MLMNKAKGTKTAKNCKTLIPIILAFFKFFLSSKYFFSSALLGSGHLVLDGFFKYALTAASNDKDKGVDSLTLPPLTATTTC